MSPQTKKNNTRVVRFLNIFADLMSCDESDLYSFGLAVVFLVLQWNPLFSTAFPTFSYWSILWFNQVFSSLVFLDVVSWVCPAHQPTLFHGLRSHLFLSISWSVLLYLGGRGWYLHPLPSLFHPPLPDTIWTDVLPVPFFVEPPQSGWSGDGAAVCRAASSSTIKIKAHRLARTAGILALIKLHYC